MGGGVGGCSYQENKTAILGIQVHVTKFIVVIIVLACFVVNFEFPPSDHPQFNQQSKNHNRNPKSI